MTHTELSPSVVLCVAAHPDDIDYHAGGTVAKFAANGAAVYYLVLTGGGMGTDDPQQSAVDLIITRQAEQIAAAKILGVREVFFAHFEDGRLQNTETLRRIIVRHIRRLMPDLVIGWDPAHYSLTHGFVNHPDHREAGEATLDAVYPEARNAAKYPEILAEGLLPHTVAHMLLLTLTDPNYISEITGFQADKAAAMEAHISQYAASDAAMVTRWTTPTDPQGPPTEGFQHLKIMI